MTSQKEFYKFVSGVEAVKSILGGHLRFSTFEELNDPCELAEDVNEKALASSLELLRHNGYSEEEFDWLRCQGELLKLLCPSESITPMPKTKEEASRLIRASLYDNFTQMIGYQKRVVKTIKQTTGILSLTTSFECLPMWAHYANNAQGFVVVFENIEAEFAPQPYTVLDTLHKVQYDDEYSGMTFQPSSTKNLFFWKYGDWKYEREYRVISNLSNCTSAPIKDGNTIWLRKTKRDIAKGVIFGWKTPESFKQQVIDFCDKTNRNIKLYEAGIKDARVYRKQLVRG